MLACAGAGVNAGMQGVLRESSLGLEAHKTAMQLGLAEATSLAEGACQTGKQQCADGALVSFFLFFAVVVVGSVFTRLAVMWSL